MADSPEIAISRCPERTNASKIVISGTVVDAVGSEPRVFINSRELSVHNTSWVATVDLNQGENRFTFVALNNKGETATATRVVICEILPLRLEVLACPEVTAKAITAILGRVRNPNPPHTLPEVQINGRVLTVETDGTWNFSSRLSEGLNDFEIVAKLEGRKPAMVRRQILRATGAPEFTFVMCPEVVVTRQVTLAGTLTTLQGQTAALQIMNKDVVIEDGAWTHQTRLDVPKDMTQGIGRMRVTYKLTGSQGFKHTGHRDIVLNPQAPKIELTKCGQIGHQNVFALAGKVTDEIDLSPTLSLNGKSVAVDRGNWRSMQTVQDGSTTLRFEALNMAGKKTVLEHIINFESAAPAVSIDDLPESITQKFITLTGSVDDPTDPKPHVLVSGFGAVVNGKRWNYKMRLKSYENAIEVKAVNALGKFSTTNASIFCAVIAPRITVDEFPAETTQTRITMTGSVSSGMTENPDGVKLRCNGEAVDVAYGQWSKELMLNEGENVFLIEAENDLGEIVELEKIIEKK